MIGFVGPLGGLVDVAAVAGVRNAELHAQVGPRQAKTVVRAVVDSHVDAARHVALDALGAGADLEENRPVGGPDRLALFALLLVKVMLPRVVGLRAMALQAEIVSFPDRPDAVYLVAVAAAHIPVIHLALRERAVHVDLVEDLAVGEIEAFVEGRGSMLSSRSGSACV